MKENIFHLDWKTNCEIFVTMHMYKKTTRLSHTNFQIAVTIVKVSLEFMYVREEALESQ